MKPFIKCELCNSAISSERCIFATYKTTIGDEEYYFCCENHSQEFERKHQTLKRKPDPVKTSRSVWAALHQFAHKHRRVLLTAPLFSISEAFSKAASYIYSLLDSDLQVMILERDESGTRVQTENRLAQFMTALAMRIRLQYCLSSNYRV